MRCVCQFDDGVCAVVLPQHLDAEALAGRGGRVKHQGACEPVDVVLASGVQLLQHVLEVIHAKTFPAGPVKLVVLGYLQMTSACVKAANDVVFMQPIVAVVAGEQHVLGALPGSYPRSDVGWQPQHRVLDIWELTALYPLTASLR